MTHGAFRRARRACHAGVVALAIALVAALGGCGEDDTPARARVVVLGFDGLDPVLTERWMDDGTLPHFAALRAAGHYQRLGTTNPPQSPVAWASFATGTDAGAHGIFDFLHRDPATYRPEFSIARATAPSSTVNLFGWSVPLDAGEIVRGRDGTPFWTHAEAAGDRATVQRVPVTFPPDPVTRMLGGMGVPDLLGTQGTYTIYATRRIAGADNGGRVVLTQIGADGAITTTLDGPTHPLKPGAGTLTVPLVIAPDGDGARITLDDATATLAVGAWSPWLRVTFDYGMGSAAGMVRAHLVEGFPRPLLYVSPIEIDPRDPAIAISSPPSYASALAERIGDYHTLGMPEETWALNQGHLGETAWLDLVKQTLAEGEAMLDDALARHDSELVVHVFVQTDRVSHMFWRGFDATHPGHAQTTPLARDAIPWIYREADRILGETRAKLGEGDRLVVLSDHGFAPFRRAVHLNSWLAQRGHLVFARNATASAPLFAQVDWSRTRAYALGLNGIFVNRAGREAQGIVAAADADKLIATLREELATLVDPANGARIVAATFDASSIYHGAHLEAAPDLVVGYASGYRASWQTSLGGAPAGIVEDNLQPWSGDHCIDPAAVPGVLFTSFAPAAPVADITGVAATIEAALAAGRAR